METNWIPDILNIVCAALLLVLSYLFKRYVPSEINELYGYRSRRSMASQENWDLANKYFTRTMWRGAWVLVGVQAGLYVFFGPHVALIGLLALWVVLLLWLMWSTERRLRQKVK